MDRGQELIYDLINVIDAEVCIIINDSATQSPVVWNKHTEIIDPVVFFPGIGISVIYHRGDI